MRLVFIVIFLVFESTKQITRSKRLKRKFKSKKGLDLPDVE